MKNFFLSNPARAMIGVSLVLVLSFMVLGTASAQYNTPPAPQTTVESVDDIFVLVSNIFNILFWALIVLAGIFIIMAAFSYLTAGGDPEKVKTANQKVIYAAVAVVVAVLARAIPTVVCSFLSTGCEFSVDGVPQG